MFIAVLIVFGVMFFLMIKKETKSDGLNDRAIDLVAGKFMFKDLK